MPAWPWRRPALPDALRSQLRPDERLLGFAKTDGGDLLAASRFGLLSIAGEAVTRWGWDRISKATLRANTLTLTFSEHLESWPDGTLVLADLPPREFVLVQPSGLTDIVHTRVRRSIAASVHLPWPRAGGWVVLRRVPGTDGLVVQVRLDPGSEPHADGFAAAVAVEAAELAASVTAGADE